MDQVDVAKLVREIEESRELIVQSLVNMLRIKAIGPENGGEGESERAKFLMALLRDLGFRDVEMMESDDPRVPSGRRPNIVVRVRGSTDRNLWVVTHMDTVPEGDMSLWTYPPYDPQIVDGRIYGRGAEDNGQELIASLFGLAALHRAKVMPEMNAGLVFVADEEHGNAHGIDFLLAKGLFKKGDIAVVPDHGQADGGAIEIVEKGSAWIGVEVLGRQTHASTPHKGINALEVAARFMIGAVDSLRSEFSASDPLFDPAVSTFEPTKCEANVPNINTVPGRQVFAFDFRVLPDYPLDDIMAELKTIAQKHARATGAKITVSFLQKEDAAPKTGLDSEIVRRLSRAIAIVRGVKIRPLGIGGGTCAAPFRKAGIEAAVWSTTPETAHDANEYAQVEDLISDAKVYAVLFAGSNVQSP